MNRKELEASNMVLFWRSRLSLDCPEQNTAIRESIICWLLGNDLERFEMLNSTQLEVAGAAMEYRYRILRHRYLGLRLEQAHRNLTTRLGSLVLLCNKVRIWITKSRENRQAVVDVLQEVIQELLHEHYIQQQIIWIAQCADDSQLRNALLLTSTEEYCLRPVHNQPLLLYRFVSYLRRKQWAELTPVPTKELIQLFSKESLKQNSKAPINLLDIQATAHYQDTQALEQQVVRAGVKQEFLSYLAEHLGPVAVQWLQLYLQGQSTEVIAFSLNLQIEEVYQIRQKVIYHAVRVFASRQLNSLATSSK